MRILYDRACALAAHYNSQHGIFSEKKAGTEWRWIAHDDEGGVVAELRNAGILDPAPAARTRR